MLNAAVALWGTWLLRPLIKGSIVGLRVKSVSRAGTAADRFRQSKHAHFACRRRDVCRRDRLHERHAVSANRHHARSRGISVVPEWQSAVQLDRRVSLSRSTRASGDVAGEQSAACAGVGWWRRFGVREILKYPSVERVTLVDLDPEMTKTLQSLSVARGVESAVRSTIRAFRLLTKTRSSGWKRPTSRLRRGDHRFSGSEHVRAGQTLHHALLSSCCRSRLTENAAVAVQSTSPMFARNSYWCIIRTLEAAGFAVRPYYTAVPSFGLWGFALARSSPFEVPRNPPPGLKFLDDQTLAAMFTSLDRYWASAGRDQPAR